ncbi:hypothetical protein [Acinetobacter gyllenbergii]|uniref:hypothetical protein n=1 Tax=Acinetobacter gyllenbergii TaxID=134534 RepID=UPI003F56A93F
MSNNVWTTTIIFDENYRVFDLCFPKIFDYVELYQLKGDSEEEKNKRKQMRRAKIEIVDQYHLGKKIAPVNAPTILYAHGFSKTVKLPSFFRTQDGFVILTEECANVLKKFSLGGSVLYPLSFFDIQLNELVNDQTYYFFNITELRSYLLPECSSNDLDKHSYTKHEGYQLYKLYHADYADHAIAIKKEAIKCDIDLWRDPELDNSIFMSDELKKALDEAQLSDAWQLFLCDIK